MFDNAMKPIFTMNSGDVMMSFYANGTYRIKGRSDGQFSYWKYEDGTFYYKHQANHEYDKDDEDTEFNAEFREKYNLYALSLIEKALE